MSNTAIIPRSVTVRRGRRLEYLTILWNSLEALVSIVAGIIAGSVALVGFGLDSIIEVSSGAVMLWRLGTAAERDHLSRARSERLALRLIGVSFLTLATYVTADAIFTLVSRHAPKHSVPGIVIGT